MFFVVSSVVLFGVSGQGGATPLLRPAAKKMEHLLTRELLTEINSLRLRHALRVLRVSPSLSRAADRHAVDMGRKGYFSHDSADGASFSGRIEHYYRSGGFRYWEVGENILWSARRLTPSLALRSWLRSPMHRANLLRRDWHQVGISVHLFPSAPGFFHRRRVWIVTIDFGVRY